MSDDANNPTQDLDTRPKFDQLLAEMRQTRQMIEVLTVQMNERFDRLEIRLGKTERKIEILNESILDLRVEVRELSNCVDLLEKHPAQA